MTEHVFDPWATTSGMLDGYTGTIVDAQFGFKPDYQNGTRLLLMIDVNTGDPEIGEGGIVSEQYPVGEKWDTNDGGQTAVHESGQEKNFNNSSGVGLLLNSIIDAGGLPTLQGTGLLPHQAKCWVGGTYVFERKEFSGKFDGKESKWNRMLVTDLSTQPAATPAQAAAPAPAAAPVATPAATPTPAAAAPAQAPAAAGEHAVPVVVKAKLKSIALASDTHDAFIEAAFAQVAEAMTDPAVEAAIGDAAWFAALKG